MKDKGSGTGTGVSTSVRQTLKRPARLVRRANARSGGTTTLAVSPTDPKVLADREMLDYVDRYCQPPESLRHIVDIRSDRTFDSVVTVDDLV